MTTPPALEAPGRPAADALLGVLRRVLGVPASKIALHEPSFTGRESALVQDCLESTYVSSVGPYVDRFEAMLAEYTGARHAIVVVNGTAALHIALTLAGVRRGDEVILPALSFVATANAVVHAGGTPHFVDSAETTMGLNPEALAAHLLEVAERTDAGARNRQTGCRIAAIVPMHTYGHPVDMEPLVALAAQYGIPIVEDAAESLGSTYHGQHTGTLGQLGTLSFNGNKLVTTGGGGAILTNDPELGRLAKHLTTTAKRPHRWAFFHDDVAWNYRMPNLNAALGCAQMERLPGMLAAKRALAERYAAACTGETGLQFVSEPHGTCSNYWLNTVRLVEPGMDRRDALLEAANDAGYQCRPTWTLLHRLPMFASSPRAALTVAERLEMSLINVPSSAHL